jgi:hypothetical protein
MDRASLNRTSSGYSSLKQASSRDYAASLSDSPMASSKRITPFLLYLVFIVTLGPLQFGYHLVSSSRAHDG